MNFYTLSTLKSNYALHYKFPKILYQFPKLIGLVFLFNRFFQLRSWYIHKAWLPILKQEISASTVIDIGTGEGQFIIPYCSSFPNIHFIAIDQNPSCIQWMGNYPLSNLTPICLNIEKETNQYNADIAICVGVLQYIQDDRQALRNIFNMLKPNANFLLYTPINGHIKTNIFRYISSSFSNYETINKRKRIYLEKEILFKLEESGFKLVSKQYAYGYFGTLSYEWFASCSILIYSGNIVLKILALTIFILIFPVILLFMILDFLLPLKNGNGLLIIAKKNDSPAFWIDLNKVNEY